MNDEKIALVFKALGDENRVRILRILHSGEKCACMLLDELNISQSTLSHHMKILCDAGLVVGHKEGKWTHYRIRCEGICSIRTLMRELLSDGNILPDCNCEKD